MKKSGFQPMNKHYNWRGGINNHSGGYIYILKKDHPFCNSRGYVFQHRLVMEKHLGRYLTKQEFVHHINQNKKDNRIENLQLFDSHSAHRLHHLKDRPRICMVVGCEKPYRCSKMCKSHYDKVQHAKHKHNKILEFAFK